MRFLRIGLLFLGLGIFCIETVAAGEWRQAGYLDVGRYIHTATLLPSGKVLVAGGFNLGASSTAELYDPSTGTRQATEFLAIPRDQHTATLLPSGNVLVVGGFNGDHLSSTELYDPNSGTWKSSGALATPREGHTATLLPSGKVLVVAGHNGIYLSSAELYDPSEGTWHSTGSLATPRREHTATLLSSGKVLVVGGNNGVNLSSAELYDPSTGIWQGAEDLALSRKEHAAILLPSGEVLVAGGWNNDSTLSSAELYDPSTGIWRSTGSLAVSRYQHTASLLPSGKVLVAGGINSIDATNTFLESAELFDPTTGMWQAAGTLHTWRAEHTATLLPSGEILVVGGVNSVGCLASVEVFDPITGGIWQGTGDLATPRRFHTATLLPQGKVLVAGGEGANYSPLSSAELFDPSTQAWQSTGELAIQRSEHTATLLPSGKVLVAGGRRTNPLSDVEVYDPSTETWSKTGSLATPRNNHTATLLPSGRILVAGGWGDIPFNAEIYDPDTEAWQNTGSLAITRVFHTATLLPSGKVLVAGGYSSGYLSSSELYDPKAGIWQNTGSLSTVRAMHTATLLPSGKVLVAGGWGAVPLASAETYDPETETWQSTGALANSRYIHAATLLPSGKVLVTGGDGESGPLSSTELFDPTTGTWQSAGPLATSRHMHTVTVLPSAAVLAAGGSNSDYLSSTELYQSSIQIDSRKPVIWSHSQTIRFGEQFSIIGDQFRGDSEATNGNTRGSAVNYPLIQLRDLDGGQQSWITPDPRPNFWDNPMTLTISNMAPTLNPGYMLLTVIAAGVPSEPSLVRLECSLAITTHPADQRSALGETVPFIVETQGGRHFQWQRNGVDIPGATGPVYTTPPITAADAGDSYRVLVDSGCTSQYSKTGAIIVTDNENPTAEVISPSGGEYWLLSAPDEPNTEVISWAMIDNIRVCQADIALIYSTDAGQTWHEAQAGGGLPASFGTSGPCPHPGEQTTNLTYTLPDAAPSGAVGSLYKVRLRITDQAGNIAAAESENSFFIVHSNPDTVKTLILSNISRMQDPLIMGIAPAQANALEVALQDLASHPRVLGQIIDLSLVSRLTGVYAAWEGDPSNTDRANDVLLAPGGLHEYLREELLPTYTGAEYIVVVGDDRIVPMARLHDPTALPEANYTDPTVGGLTVEGTTVGQALNQNRYLSDGILAVTSPVTLPLRPEIFASGAFLPELAVGRLVENPDEIINTIATFISQDGILDLGELLDTTSHKVLVTGYDFLSDSAIRVRERWQRALTIPVDPNVEAPVDGRLIGVDWDVATVDLRRDLLLQHLSGNAGGRYGINNLNGHATHFAEGVPGQTSDDIQGLSAAEIYGPHECSSELGIDLPGAVVYAIGCHGGLPVAGSCIDDPDHSLDLPQTMMASGVVAYVANSGYGWGIKYGIGLSERLVEIFTEEMTAGGTIKVGDAIVRSKLRYFLELPGFAVYDEKTLLQWTLFGLPMYAVQTGIEPGGAPAIAGAPRETSEEHPAREHYGPVVVDRELVASGNRGAALPPHLTQLNLHFDFTGPGVYTKYNSRGESLGPSPGCPDPDGCYYTLNGLVERGTGTPDLPIQPYFTYDSRLSGTSQHGALWVGGTYDEEDGWIPVIAELMSNGGDFSDHGSTPRLIKPKPFPRGHRTTGDDPECRPTDLELNSLVVIAGEALKEEETDSTYTRQRLYMDLDLEILYFNDQGGGGNCDRLGPTLAPGAGGAYHQVTGSWVDWAVSASDAAGVWRVVVVYDLGLGRWEPLELVDDGTGIWRGSLSAGGAPRLTYLIQAVDQRGNVSWLDYVPTEDPASGVDTDLPWAVDVPIVPGTADLAVTLNDGPDPVAAFGSLIYTMEVSNGGPDPATSVEVIATLPDGTHYLVGGGDGWGCEAPCGTLVCKRDRLAPGPAPPISVLVSAPAAGGTLTATASVTAMDDDPDPGNNLVSEQTTVPGGGLIADLAVSKDDGQTTAVPGEPISYTITVINLGPDSVSGLNLADALPPEILTPSFLAGTGRYCAETGAWTGLHLASGGSVTLRLEGLIDACAAGGQLVNAVSILPGVGVTDPDGTNDSASDTDLLTPQTDLAIAVDDEQETVVPGEPISYTITVTNLGPSTPSSLTLINQVPPVLLSPVFVPSSGIYDSTTGLWSDFDLIAGRFLILTVSATVDPAARGDLIYTASVWPSAGMTDPNADNDSATDMDVLTPRADLTITKDDGGVDAVPEELLSYVLTVTNFGPSYVGATVTDIFPAELEGVEWSCQSSEGASCTASGLGDLNDAAELPPGGVVTYSTTGLVSATARDTIRNTATVEPSPDVEDPNPWNNSATVETVVVSLCELFYDDIEAGTDSWLPESGSGDTGSNPWQITTADSHSGLHSWFVPDEPYIKEQILAMSENVWVPFESPPVIEFWHRFDTENDYDGGVLEYSLDYGASWHDILAGDGQSIPADPDRFLVDGYGGELSTYYGNPLAGRPAWSGDSAGWRQVGIDLSDFRGLGVRFRWRFGADNSGAAVGWWIDDIEVNQCFGGIFADGFEFGDTAAWSTSVP